MSRKPIIFDPNIFKDVLSEMSEARLAEGAKRKGRRWSLDTITPKFNLWKRSASLVDAGPLSHHRYSIATPETISEEGHKGVSPERGRLKKSAPCREIFAILNLADGGHIVLSGHDEGHLKSLYLDAAMEYRVSSYRVIVASTKSILKLDNGSPTVTKSYENVFEKYETVDPPTKHEDPRFGLTEDLLLSEREYCTNLRSVFDCYAEPLRKYSSLSKDDHRMLFMAVEPILSISAMLASKLEGVIQSWNTHTSKLGNLFPSKFWNQYNEYYDTYSATKSFLEEKCKSDSTFAEFCKLRKEQGKIGIDTLLYLPIKRIPEYDKYLNDLLDETDTSHPDFDDLKKAVNKVNSMVREREDELRDADNDNKVEAVQERFPHDDLQLRDREKAQKTRGLSSRRKSAPSAVLFKTLGSTKSKSSTALWSQNIMGKKESDGGGTARQSSTSSEGNRLYIMEGPVQLAAGMQTQDRYLFLFNDLLLIAKQKSSTTFKLKHRIQLCDVWIAHCIDEVTEITRPQDRSFVIGWPTTNTVATFKDAETKDKWLTKLSAQIQEEKLKEESRTTQVKIVNRNIDQKCTVTVNNMFEAKDVLRMCMEQLLIPDCEQKDYQLWVLTGKEGAVYPLIGHEYPYAIKLNHVRDILKTRGDVDPEVLSNMDSILEESSTSKVEFILKHKKANKKHSLEETSQKSLKKSKKSPLLTLFKRNKDDKPVYPLQSSNSKPGKLFERPLGDVCDGNGEPPKAIMDIMTILFKQGPFTSGILRRSANIRQIRELRQLLDNEEEVNLDDYNMCLIGALIKDYFRSLPDCLLGNSLFDQWIKTVDMEDEDERLNAVIELYHQLPLCNQTLLKLLMSVLYQIDQHQDDNKMSANNISVCIAPSLLSMKTTDQTVLVSNPHVNAVNAVVEFMITNACHIFGEDIPHLLGELDHKMRQDSGTDSDSLNNLRRDDSSIDSLVERDLYSGEVESSPKLAKSHLSPSNLSHDSGLSHSDTQLNDGEFDYDATERKMYFKSSSYHDQDGGQIDYRKSADGYYSMDSMENPVPPPRYRKRKEIPQSSSFDGYNHHYGNAYVSGSQLSHTLDPDMLRQVQLSKRISCDSLHSVEESTEGESEHEFPARQKSDIYLIKSASGAHLYLDNETLPRHSSLDSQMGKTGRERLVRQASVTDSTPPLSPHSKFSYGSSYDSVLSDSSYLQDLSRGNSVNSAPQTPDELPDHSLTWGTQERERSNSNPTRLHSNVNYPQDSSSSSNKLCASYGGYSLKSMQNMKYLVSPPASPQVERRTKTTESVRDPSARHSVPASTFKTTVQKDISPVTSPVISITYCSSGSDERLDNSDSETARQSFESGAAPVKQISVYSQGIASQPVTGHQRMSPRKDSSPVKASHDSAILSQIRRSSFETSVKGGGERESQTSSLQDNTSKPTVLKRSYAHNYDIESKTDTDVSEKSGSRRPNQPPPYQEAVHRTYLMKQGIPLEISEQDTQKQKEASARAKKLYADSLKKYLGACDTDDSSEASGGIEMKQTSKLKQHIEQTSDPGSNTYSTRVEHSSSVIQTISPEDQDVYVTLRAGRKNPREVYAQSMKLYEQQAKEDQKNEIKPGNRSQVSSPLKDKPSAYSKTDISPRKTFDRDPFRSYMKVDSSKTRPLSDSSKVNVSKDCVRTSAESKDSISRMDSNERVKTSLNVPNLGLHRSLSDSADRLNKLSKYSPRMSRHQAGSDTKSSQDSSDSKGNLVTRATYFYQPNEDRPSSAVHQYSSKVPSQMMSKSSSNLTSLQQVGPAARTSVTVTVNSSTGGSSSSKQDFPWSVSKLKNMFDADKSSGITSTASSHFYSPEQKSNVSTVTITTTSRPAEPPPYKSPPPFRRAADKSRLSTSSSSSNGSTGVSSPTKSQTRVSPKKFGPQSFDSSSFSSSSEDLDTLSRYPFNRRESGSGLSDQEIDTYTDISYV